MLTLTHFWDIIQLILLDIEIWCYYMSLYECMKILNKVKQRVNKVNARVVIHDCEIFHAWMLQLYWYIGSALDDE